jgi:hypothetical protein
MPDIKRNYLGNEINNLATRDEVWLSYDSVSDAAGDLELEIGDFVKTAGYYSENDGGGAEYVVVVGGTGTDDEGSYHDMSNGLQLRLTDRDSTNILKFGADPSGTADSTQAIQNAINYIGMGGGEVLIPRGTYLHSGVYSEGLRFVHIKGVPPSSFSTAGPNGVRLVCDSTSPHFDLLNPFKVIIEYIQMEYSGNPTSEPFIKMVATGGGSAKCEVKNVRTEGGYNGILVDGVSNSTLEQVELREGVGTYGIRIGSTNKRIDQVHLSNIVIDTAVSTGSLTYDGIVLTGDTHTIWINSVSCLKCKNGFNLIGTGGTEFTRLVGAEAENCSRSGFLIDSARHIWMKDIYSSVNYGNGITFGAGFSSTAYIDSPDVRGNGGNGILVNGSEGVVIQNPRIGGNSSPGRGGVTNTSHGISISSNVDRVSVIGGNIGGDINLSGTGSQRNGVLINSGTSDSIVVTGVNLGGNANQPIVDSSNGLNKVIKGNLSSEDEGEFKGSLTVLNGATTASINHELGTAPSEVTVNPTSNYGTTVNWWVTTTSTQVIVSFTSPATVNSDFSVVARV